MSSKDASLAIYHVFLLAKQRELENLVRINDFFTQVHRQSKWNCRQYLLNFRCTLLINCVWNCQSSIFKFFRFWRVLLYTAARKAKFEREENSSFDSANFVVGQSKWHRQQWLLFVGQVAAKCAQLLLVSSATEEAIDPRRQCRNVSLLSVFMGMYAFEWRYLLQLCFSTFSAVQRTVKKHKVFCTVW